MDNQLRQIIEEAWNDRALLAESRVREAVRAVIEELDKGRLRTAEPIDPSRSQWQVNEWVKKAILLYFPMPEMRTMPMPPGAGAVEMAAMVFSMLNSLFPQIFPIT